MSYAMIFFYTTDENFRNSFARIDDSRRKEVRLIYFFTTIKWHIIPIAHWFYLRIRNESNTGHHDARLLSPTRSISYESLLIFLYALYNACLIDLIYFFTNYYLLAKEKLLFIHLTFKPLVIDLHEPLSMLDFCGYAMIVFHIGILLSSLLFSRFFTKYFTGLQYLKI